LITNNSYPITAWRVDGNRAEPISFAPPPTSSAELYIFYSGKIFTVDGLKTWTSYDLFCHFLLQHWKAKRQIRDTPIPPNAVQVGSGDAVVLHRF
jgi:hypothetical protein